MSWETILKEHSDRERAQTPTRFDFNEYISAIEKYLNKIKELIPDKQDGMSIREEDLPMIKKALELIMAEAKAAIEEIN